MNEKIKKMMLDNNLPLEPIVEIEKGTSNRCFSIANLFFYREKVTSDPHFYHPVYELRIMVEAFKNGIGLPPLYFDETNGDFVMPFITYEKVLPTDGSASKEDILKVIDNLKALQRMEVSMPPFDAVRRLEKYRDEAGVRGVFPFEDHAIEAVVEYMKGTKMVPSHNDLVGDNVLFFNGASFIVDWEFAGYNDPYFDLASLISENKITDPILIDEALYSLFGAEADMNKLEAFLAFEDILWGYWALYREKMTGNPVFRQIFEDKKAAYEGRQSIRYIA